MIVKNSQKNKGFVILFAVTLSAILLSIALGAANIAFKELKFGTNVRDTNNAFFAADTGVEYMLFLDIIASSFPPPNAPGSQTYDPISISELGSAGASCAIVSIKKDTQEDNQIPPSTTLITTITSKGYNTGGNVPGSCNPSSNSVEREIIVTYSVTI